MKALIALAMLLAAVVASAEEFGDRMDIGALRARNYRPAPPSGIDPNKEPAPGDLMMAVSLLGMAEDAVAKGDFKGFNTEEIRYALRWLAHDRQLVSLRETSALLTMNDYELFLKDWAMLRRYHRELKDAPRLEMANMFPPLDVVKEWLSFNRKHHEFLLTVAPLDLPQNRAARQNWIQQNQLLHDLWDRIRLAHEPMYAPIIRRTAMKEFLEHDWVKNSEKYFKTPFPPQVPIWYFQEIR